MAAYLVPQVMATPRSPGCPPRPGWRRVTRSATAPWPRAFALVVGLLCVLGRLVGAGALADLLSKPVLVGTEERLFMTLPTAVAAYHAWESDHR